MSDVTPPTDAPNLTPETPTGDPAATGNPSSTTTPTDPVDPPADPVDPPADPLDGGTLLDGDPPADPTDPDPKDGDDDAPVLIGAPEGDYDLTGFLEDGQTIDAEALEAISPLAKELNLSNAGLAKLAQAGQPVVLKQVQQAIAQDVMAVRTGWDNDTRAAISGGKTTDGVDIEPDPVFQGKTLEEVQTVAAKAIDRFGGSKLFPGVKPDGSPGTFREFLRATGLGNHPAMVQFAYLAGTQIAEDTDLPRGGSAPNAPKTREEKYYGS